MDDARVENLEVKVAFLEHLVAQLEGVVLSQADAIDRLRRDILNYQEAVGWASAKGSLADEVPPHHERV